MYKAEIEFEACEDNYNNGQSMQCDNTWYETLEANTADELKEKIAEVTYTPWEKINHEDMNDYPNQSEYWTSYLADENNEGDASESDIAEWKQGKCKLWAINCHILVSKTIEEKAVL